MVPPLHPTSLSTFVVFCFHAVFPLLKDCFNLSVRFYNFTNMSLELSFLCFCRYFIVLASKVNGILFLSSMFL
jgi:hypothetical protein